MSKSYEWDLSGLYASPDDPQMETDLVAAETALEAFAAKWEDRTDYLSQPSVLREALADYEALEYLRGASAPSYFHTLSRVIDQSNSDLKGRATVLSDRLRKTSDRLRFFALSLGTIDVATQQLMLAAPELMAYRAYLKRRFAFAPHDLSVETTSALSRILPQASGAWQSMLEELLSEKSAKVFTGSKVEDMPFNGLSSLLSSSDKRVVREAGTAMTRIMRGLAPVAEREINAIVTTKARLSKLHGYDRPDAGRFMSDGLSAEIAETMLTSVESQFELSHQFYDLKARLLGRKTFAYYQRSAGYGKLPENYSFEQACTMLRRVLMKLHPDFAAEFDEALSAGHIDAFPRKGKRGGAACWHSALPSPVYLMLNFTGKLRDVQTLAHEFGHYLNNRHMQDGGLCDGLTYGAPTPLAEVASTFFEKFILDAVLEEADEETRLAILVATLENQLGTIFRQTSAMRFEQELYRQITGSGYLSHGAIGELFARHMSAYLGPRVSMKSGASLGWLHWGHFRQGFYNYGYTFALLVAQALQSRVAADPGYIEEFRRFLRTGSSQAPQDLLSSMGLDIASDSVWQLGLGQFEATLREAEALAT